MGCDIHAFVEYERLPANDHSDGYWDCLMSNIGHRDYTFFSLLADCGRGEHEPLIYNRGLPEGPMSHVVEEEMWLTIDDELKDEQGYCSAENAKSWGGETRVRGKYKQVMHPDLHSHSWLTCDELAQVIAAYITTAHNDWPYGVEWDAALAAMRALEERGFRARMVFAFDN